MGDYGNRGNRIHLAGPTRKTLLPQHDRRKRDPSHADTRQPRVHHAHSGRIDQAEGQFTTRGFWPPARLTLGFLARHQEDRSIVRSFLAGKLNHPKKAVQTAAMRALEQLRDQGPYPFYAIGFMVTRKTNVSRSCTRKPSLHWTSRSKHRKHSSDCETRWTPWKRTTALSKKGALRKHSKTNGTPWKASKDLDQSPQKKDVPGVLNLAVVICANTDLALP